MSTTRRNTDQPHNPLGEYVVHVGTGFVAKERPQVLAALATLGNHLGRWNPREVSLEVSLQDRGRREQRVTLRTTLPGHSPLVAIADHPDITRALHDAKHELIRQVEHQKSVHEPMHNRKLVRDTIRHPGTVPAHRPS